MLRLDDPRWPDLNHRGWSAGRASSDDPAAPFVPDELRHLLANPADRQRFTALWPYLYSEGTAWPAAYAAVPYLVEIARQLSPAKRVEHVYVVGLVVMCSGTYGRTPDGLPADITANLGGADLTGANLGGANLTGANLTRADLTDADLTRADLTRADLTRAPLSGVRWPADRPVPPGWQRDRESGRLKATWDPGDTAVE